MQPDRGRTVLVKDACVRTACRPVGIGQTDHSRYSGAEKMLNVVAVVDDDPVMLDAVGHMLKVAGYKTELYVSAEAYLANVGTSAATCLVSDINLDGISGIELRRQLVADGVPIPTILMSGDDNHATEKAAIDAGCVAFLRKPFPISLLLAAIEAACGSESRDAARKPATSDTPDRKTSSASPARCA